MICCFQKYFSNIFWKTYFEVAIFFHPLVWVQIYCSSKQRQSFQPFNMICSLFLCTPPNVFYVVFKTVNDDVESVLLKYQWCSEKNESNRNICFMNNGIWEEPDLIIRALFNHLIIVQTVPPAREEQVVWTSLVLFLYLGSSCLRCAKCVCVFVYTCSYLVYLLINKGGWIHLFISWYLMRTHLASGKLTCCMA